MTVGTPAARSPSIIDGDRANQVLWTCATSGWNRETTRSASPRRAGLAGAMASAVAVLTADSGFSAISCSTWWPAERSNSASASTTRSSPPASR
jgi:hypothetical protein